MPTDFNLNKTLPGAKEKTDKLSPKELKLKVLLADKLSKEVINRIKNSPTKSKS